MQFFTCNQFMDEFLVLDKNERLPLPQTFHLLTCKECRSQVRLFTLADRACSKAMKTPSNITDPSVTSILKAINPQYEVPEDKPLSLSRWVISGIIMILAMLCFGISDTASNTQLSIYFYLVFACIVTAYSALFIGCNMDFFVKHIQKFQSEVK